MLRPSILSGVTLASLIAIACTLEDPKPATGSGGQGGSATNDAGETSNGATTNAGGDTAGSTNNTAGKAATGAGGEGGETTGTGGAGGAGATTGAAGSGGDSGLQPRTLPCAEELVTDLPVVAGKVSSGVVSNQKTGATFTSKIDATAGGVANAPTNPWTYLSFTPQGLVQVAVDDAQALTSLDWDIAAKRNQIRLNGGDSGPSYVSASVLKGTAYDSVTAQTATTPLVSERFYDAACDFQATELNQPTLILDAWFQYEGCLITTSTPFVLELADETRLKLVVDTYYTTGQDTCNTTGTAGTGAANFTLRWQYL